jgi:ribosome modulation factor
MGMEMRFGWMGGWIEGKEGRLDGWGVIEDMV